MQPRVGLSNGTVVSVMVHIGDNDGVSGKLVCCKVRRELSKGHNVLLQTRAVDYVGIPFRRIVPLDISAGIATQVADARQPFGIEFPGNTRRAQLAENVVTGNRLRTAPASAAKPQLSAAG